MQETFGIKTSNFEKQYTRGDLPLNGEQERKYPVDNSFDLVSPMAAKLPASSPVMSLPIYFC